MDRDFIARNQIVERYFANRLPAKGALDFERYCREHPELIAELKIVERVHAGVRLMEAGGASLPWEVREPRFWERLPVAIGVALLAITASVTALVFHSRHVNEAAAIVALKNSLAAQPLDPVQSTRTLKVELNHEGPVRAPAYTIAGSRAELAELKLQLAWSTYSQFRLAVDRVGQGRVLVLDNLQRDSNGEVRLAFNTHLLGPGNYQLQIDGLNLRGESAPQGWTTLAIAR